MQYINSNLVLLPLPTLCYNWDYPQVEICAMDDCCSAGVDWHLINIKDRGIAEVLVLFWDN